ncbi:MAG: hypothetical protein ACLVEJ_09560 [Parabacteroides sp.]
MKRHLSLLAYWHIGILLLVAIATNSCDLDAELPDCDYTARLEYWYVFTGTANELPDYVDTMDEYLFDASGILRQVEQIGWRQPFSPTNWSSPRAPTPWSAGATSTAVAASSPPSSAKRP